MLRIFIIVLIISSFACCAYCDTFYVSADGKLNGKGSMIDPFSWNNFENKLDALGGGHTFIFKPGYYIGRQITLRSKQKGTPQNPTILKSQQRYKAVLHGSRWHNIYVNKGADWVIIDGFVSSGAGFTGIKSNADYNVIRYCWIVNNAQGIEAHNVKGTVIENNLIEFNGRHIQFDHGVYADGDSLILRNNIVRFNSSFGMHLYSSICNSRIENNLVYGNNRVGIAVFGDGVIGGNIVINNTVVRNGSGISLNNPKADVVYNNIAVENKSVWRWDNESSNQVIAQDIVINDCNDFSGLKIDYNLCSVKSRLCGSHTIIGDPLFLRRMKGLFYLKSNSPAIAKGSADYFAEKDFFGKVRNSKNIDMGCFVFDQSLLDDSKRKAWYLNWPYHYRDDKADSQIPDLWKD